MPALCRNLKGQNDIRYAHTYKIEARSKRHKKRACCTWNIYFICRKSKTTYLCVALCLCIRHRRSVVHGIRYCSANVRLPLEFV